MRFLHSLWPARVGLAVLLLVEVLGAAGVLPIQPEFTWKGMILQDVFVWLVIEIVAYLIKRHGLNMSLGPAALLITIQVIVDASGDMGHLYGRFLWYDQILHFTGGFTASILTTGFLQAIHRKKRANSFYHAEILILGAALAIWGTVLYELEEYIEDLLTGSMRLGDGFDTANDLLLGMFGAILAALIVVKVKRLTSRR